MSSSLHAARDALTETFSDRVHKPHNENNGTQLLPGSEPKSHVYMDSSSDISLTTVSTLDVTDSECQSSSELGNRDDHNVGTRLPQNAMNDGSASFPPPAPHDPMFLHSAEGDDVFDFSHSETEVSDHVDVSVHSQFYDQRRPDLTARCMLDFDAASIAQKIATQRTCHGSSCRKLYKFKRSRTTGERDAATRRKSSCLPLKKKIRKFGQAAHLFVHHNILRQRGAALQRCELILNSCPEGVDNVVLVFTKTTQSAATEKVSIYLPSDFENKVVIPQCLLPKHSQEVVHVVICGLTQVKQGGLQGFSQVCASATCCLQTDNERQPCLVVPVELAPHSPQCGLLSHRKTLTSCTVLVGHQPPSQYHFESKPHQVATHFTEMMLLQTAAPFQEHFKMASSSCDHPASFCVDLQPRAYHAACMYRLTSGPVSGVFAVPCAAAPVCFKTYTEQAESSRLLEQTKAMISGGEVTHLSYLLLTKPRNFDLQNFFTACTYGKPQTLHDVGITSRRKSIIPTRNIHLDGLRFAAWDGGVRNLHSHPCEWIQVPALAVFNLGTQLYFADSWSFYERHYVTLVLTTKGSETHKTCKKLFCKLDPYSNPFFFRKRTLFPEPAVEVYASSTVSVEILFSDSTDVTEILQVPDNVYSSKLEIEHKADIK